jgi:ABC-type branched-subunit amino acid transport system substrate-binding protein
MAAQDINAQAGGNGAIKLVIKDSAGHPDVAAAGVRDLVLNQKVAAIVGPLSRAAAEAAATEAQQLWVPIITLTQKTGISEVGDYVFRDFLSNEQQTRALVEYAVLGLGYSRFAILYPNDGYGTRLAHLFWDDLDRLGAEVRGAEAYEPSQTDFAEQIKKLVGLHYPRPEIESVEESRKAIEAEILTAELGVPAPETEEEEEPLPILDFEAIFVPDGYEKVGLIAPQLAYYDVTGVKLLGTNLWNSPKLIEMAGPYLRGAVFVDGFFPESRLPLTRQFVRNYEKSYGEKPGSPEAQAYDTIRLLSEALHQPGVTSRPQLRDALLGVRMLSGVAGTASVSDRGEVNKQPFLITIKRRRMAELDLDFEKIRQRKPFWDFFTGTKGSLSTGESSPIPESKSPGGIQ